MSKRPNKRNLQHRTANEDGNVEYLRKQTRFGSETQIQGINSCALCGKSFKKVDRYVVKSEKGHRINLCKGCACKYPTAKPHTTATTHKLTARGV